MLRSILESADSTIHENILQSIPVRFFNLYCGPYSVMCFEIYTEVNLGWSDEYSSVYNDHQDWIVPCCRCESILKILLRCVIESILRGIVLTILSIHESLSRVFLPVSGELSWKFTIEYNQQFTAQWTWEIQKLNFRFIEYSMRYSIKYTLFHVYYCNRHNTEAN